MVHFTKFFVIATIVVTPALAVPLPLDDTGVDLVIRDPFFKKFFRRINPKKVWNGVKKVANVARKVIKTAAPFAAMVPGPIGVAGRVATFIPRELQEELFTRALQKELAARGYEVQFDARDYEDRLEAREDGMVDLETRELFNVLARDYADALEARDFDDELAARDFVSKLDARGFGGDEFEARDELEVREPEPELLSYDELD
jgi:hypothetical protein